jgi:hypothetical protein
MDQGAALHQEQRQEGQHPAARYQRALPVLAVDLDGA